MLEKLRTLDPHDLDWHAQRYDSAVEYRALIRQARCMSLSPGEILNAVQQIAELCQEDGADFGMIPCLAGTPNDVWQELVAELNDPGDTYQQSEFFGEGYFIR